VKNSRVQQILAMMAGSVGLDHLMGQSIPNSYPGKRGAGRAKKIKENNGYKPAFSCGFRGFPRTMTRPGSVTAPTLDQVRHIERNCGQKLHVKSGLLYFKSDGFRFSWDEARKRQAS